MVLALPLKVKAGDNEVRVIDPNTGEVILRAIGNTTLNAVQKMLRLTKDALAERKEIENESRRIS